jgi:hypothetical protein
MLSVAADMVAVVAASLQAAETAAAVWSPPLLAAAEVPPAAKKDPPSPMVLDVLVAVAAAPVFEAGDGLAPNTNPKAGGGFPPVVVVVPSAWALEAEAQLQHQK